MGVTRGKKWAGIGLAATHMRGHSKHGRQRAQPVTNTGCTCGLCDSEVQSVGTAPQHAHVAHGRQPAVSSAAAAGLAGGAAPGAVPIALQEWDGAVQVWHEMSAAASSACVSARIRLTALCHTLPREEQARPPAAQLPPPRSVPPQRAPQGRRKRSGGCPGCCCVPPALPPPTDRQSRGTQPPRAPCEGRINGGGDGSGELEQEAGHAG